MCCQILILTKHNPEERDAIIESVWNHLADVGKQKDGFGAAWSVGRELGYRKSSVPMIFDSWPQFCEGADKSFTKAVNANKPSDGGALLIHGRTSTNTVCLENTHPMIGCDHPHALIHNGTIESQDHFNYNSTCDSELLIRAMEEGGLDEVAKSISGIYAFASLQLDSRQRWVLQIARDFIKVLHVGVMPDSGAYVFATTIDLVRSVGATYLAEMKSLTSVLFIDSEYTATIPFVKTAPLPTTLNDVKAVIRAAMEGYDPEANAPVGESKRERKKRINKERHELRDKALQAHKSSPPLLPPAHPRASAAYDTLHDKEQERLAELKLEADAERTNLLGYGMGVD